MKKIINTALNLLGYDLNRKWKLDDNIYSIFPDNSISKKYFYNIGAGAFEHKYWTNIDYSTEYYSTIQKDFIQYNLMELKPLPVEDNKAEIVYSSHTIEHVTDEAAIHMFKESYRILKPGGCIRLSSPNAWLDCNAYSRNDIEFWYWRDWYSKNGSWENLYNIPLNKASIHQLFLSHFASQLCEINIDGTTNKKYSDSEIIKLFSRNINPTSIDYFTKQCKFNSNYPGNHINWWTHKKVISFLKDSGFPAPYISGWGQSVLAPLRDTSLFDNTHPRISLYVEAIK